MSQIRPEQFSYSFVYYYPSLRIRGQLPAPLVRKWRRRAFEMEAFPTIKARDPDLASSQTVYRRASLIDLYLHAKFH